MDDDNTRDLIRDLALALRPAGHRSSARTEPGSLDGVLRVLVIEDELKLATLIRRALSEQGMPADVASSGEDALWMAAARSYDVLLLDLNLPGTDAREVRRRLRAQGVSTPVLMLTASDRIDEGSTDTDGCAEDYLAKPFDFDELFARVRRLARREPR